LNEIRKKKTEEVLYEVIPDYVVTVNKDDIVEDCNEKIVNSFGFSKDELVGTPTINFIAEEDKKSYLEILQRIHNGEQVMEYDLHIKKKDGNISHSIWNSIPMFDDKKEYIGYMATGVDLAEIDKLRDELARKEKLEQEKELIKVKKKKTEEVLFETIPNPVVTFDQNNKVIDCNQYFLDATGFSKDEIFRISAPDFLTEESMKTYRDVILPSLREGKPLMDIDLHIKKKDGDSFHALWSHIRNLDENNKYLGFTAIGLDLTEIDKLRDELVEKELEKIRKQKTEELLYDVIPDCVVTFDKNNRLVDCNKKFTDALGFSKDEMIGKSVLDLVPEEERELALDVMQRLGKGETIIELDLHPKRKDGSTFHSIWSAIPIFDDNKEYAGSSSIGIDLTEIDKLRDELVKKEKIATLGQLATNLAHDIKNPLASMKQSLEIIQRKTKDDEVTKKESERANRVIKRIEHQVDQVLNYVKTLPLQTKHTTVLTILKQSLDLLTIPNNISIEISEEDFGVKWDETQISVVFTNIILNAIQAIGKDEGKISIRIAQENDFIKIEIEDTGPDIPEKDLDKIFEPLFTTKMEGTGLGLAGCTNIIKTHMGTFTVTNNPVKFTIKIPKYLDDFNLHERGNI